MKTPREYIEELESKYSNPVDGKDYDGMMRFQDMFLIPEWYDEELLDDPELGNHMKSRLRWYGFYQQGDNDTMVIPDREEFEFMVYKEVRLMIELLYEGFEQHLIDEYYKHIKELLKNEKPLAIEIQASIDSGFVPMSKLRKLLEEENENS